MPDCIVKISALPVLLALNAHRGAPPPATLALGELKRAGRDVKGTL
jgi:hypothetical protein